MNREQIIDFLKQNMEEKTAKSGKRYCLLPLDRRDRIKDVSDDLLQNIGLNVKWYNGNMTYTYFQSLDSLGDLNTSNNSNTYPSGASTYPKGASKIDDKTLQIMKQVALKSAVEFSVGRDSAEGVLKTADLFFTWLKD